MLPDMWLEHATGKALSAGVRGVAQASDYVALDHKRDITTFPAVRAASRRAYEMAGVSATDIEFAEVHDCFTIAEIVALEDLGLVERGCGGFFSAEGGTRRDGERIRVPHRGATIRSAPRSLPQCGRFPSPAAPPRP